MTVSSVGSPGQPIAMSHSPLDQYFSILVAAGVDVLFKDLNSWVASYRMPV
jgi:hypothetical protein